MSGRREVTRRCRGESGAVLPELALMLPVLAILVLGVLEFGQAYRQVNLVERAATNAARTGSSIGNGWSADYEILRSVQTSTANLGSAEIVSVVVWDATSSDEVPANCESIVPADGSANGVGNLCNVYSAAQVEDDSFIGFQRTGSGDTIDCASGSWDSNWCPTDRDNGRPDSDYVGVWIKITYEGFTGILPSDFEIERSAIFQVEPEAYTGD
jgi:hypothetical protein